MTIEGIDLSPTPINIDNERTRAFVREVLAYPDVEKDWYRKKLMYFVHHITDHRNWEKSEIMEDLPEQSVDKLRYWALKYPEEWERISNRMDRHRMVLMLAYAYVQRDPTDLIMSNTDDLHLLECAAYQGVISVNIVAIMDTYDTLLSIERYAEIKQVPITDPRNAVRIANMVNAQFESFRQSQRQILDHAAKFLDSRRKR